MADRVIQRNDTAARWQSINPILATGEIGIEIDGAKGYKIGDGKTRWNDLPYPANPTNVVQELGNNENAVPSQKLVTEKLTELGSQVIYDVSANNESAKFASLYELLSSVNLSTLIPVAVRCGGMSIRFVQTSDNKYVQYRLMATSFSTTPSDWQGVDNEPTLGSDNLIESGGVASKLIVFDDLLHNYYRAASGERIEHSMDYFITNPIFLPCNSKIKIYNTSNNVLPLCKVKKNNDYISTLIELNSAVREYTATEDMYVSYSSLYVSEVSFPIIEYKYSFPVNLSEIEKKIENNVSSIENTKVDKYILSSNLIDPSRIIWGKILRNDGVSERTVDLIYGYYSEYIPLNGQSITAYSLLSDNNRSFLIYNSNKEFLRTYDLENLGTGTFTPSEGDAYVRLNFYANEQSVKDTCRANYGITLNEYVPYDGNPIKGYLIEIEERLDNIDVDNKVDKSLDLRNILNPEWIHWGGIWQNNAYREVDNSYGYTDLISCAYPNKLIVYRALADGGNVTFSVYNSSGTYLRQIAAPNSDNTTALFTSQEGDAFIRINLFGGSTTQHHANYGETLNDYTPYNDNPIYGYLTGIEQDVSQLRTDVDEIQENIQDFVGITTRVRYSISSFISSVICIGDSMTAGVIGMETFNKYSYPTYLSRITGWTIENTGTGGQTPRGWWAGKFSNYTYTNYEIAIIYLGQNEGLTETLDTDTFDGIAWVANTEYTIGDKVLYNKIGRKCTEAHTSGETFDDSKWTNAYADYADTNTGCYCKIIEGMLVQNPLLKIFLLCGTSPNSWESSANGRVISQISQRYGLPVFNIKNNPWITLLSENYHPYNDTIHYGPMGYNALARVIYAYLMKYFTEHEIEFVTWPLE